MTLRNNFLYIFKTKCELSGTHVFSQINLYISHKSINIYTFIKYRIVADYPGYNSALNSSKMRYLNILSHFFWFWENGINIWKVGAHQMQAIGLLHCCVCCTGVRGRNWEWLVFGQVTLKDDPWPIMLLSFSLFTKQEKLCCLLSRREQKWQRQVRKPEADRETDSAREIL